MWKRGEQVDAWIVALLAVWLGVLVTAGITAATIFPMVRDMHATVPGLVLPEGEHWKYIAGKVQFRVFALSDFVQFWFGVCAFSLTILQWKAGRGLAIGAILWRLRVVLALVGALLVGYYELVFMPGTREQLSQMWRALDVGDIAAAKVAQAAFEAGHSTSSRLLEAIAVVTLVHLVLAAVSIGKTSRVGG